MRRTAFAILIAASLSPACDRAEDARNSTAAPAAAAPASPPAPEVEGWQVALPRPAAVPRNPAAGPAGTDHHMWLLNATPRSNFPSLSYMSLDGEEIVFDLWCRWRGAVVLARMKDWDLNGATLHLASGPHRLSERLSGSGEGDEGFMVGAVLNELDPVLRNFGLTGRLTMRLRGRTVTLDAVDDGERAAVRRFFELCYSEAATGGPLPWRQPPSSRR